MDWWQTFPRLSDETLRAMRQSIDEGFRNFTRTYGSAMEAFFDPLRQFLIQSERLLLNAPWPLVILCVAAIAWFASRSWKIVAGSVLTLLAIGLFDM